ncbi:hypothetical protein AMK21_18995 [Streptomyces sp. CB00316]|nr:hypothetical protein AMK21_18995 [Streptomyces sp. CB00316]
MFSTRNSTELRSSTVTPLYESWSRGRIASSVEMTAVRVSASQESRLVASRRDFMRSIAMAPRTPTIAPARAMTRFCWKSVSTASETQIIMVLPPADGLLRRHHSGLVRRWPGE